MITRTLLVIFIITVEAGFVYAFDYQFDQYFKQQQATQQRMLEAVERRQNNRPQPVFRDVKPYDINIPNPGESFLDGYQQALDIKINQEQLKLLKRQNSN